MKEGGPDSCFQLEKCVVTLTYGDHNYKYSLKENPTNRILIVIFF